MAVLRATEHAAKEVGAEQGGESASPHALQFVEAWGLQDSCDGAGDGIRTRDPLLGKQLRYHCATPACAPTVYTAQAATSTA